MYSVCFWLRADVGGCKCRRKVKLKSVIIYNVSENQQLNRCLTGCLTQGQTAWHRVIPRVRRWHRFWPGVLSGVSKWSGFDPVFDPVYTYLCTKVVVTQVNTLGLTKGIDDLWIYKSDTGSNTGSNLCLVLINISAPYRSLIWMVLGSSQWEESLRGGWNSNPLPRPH